MEQVKVVSRAWYYEVTVPMNGEGDSGQSVTIRIDQDTANELVDSLIEAMA